MDDEAVDAANEPSGLTHSEDLGGPLASRVLTHRQVLIIYSGLVLGLFLASLDQSIVSTALPTIVGDLGGLNKLSWVVTGYLLASTVTMPVYGKLSDLYGRKIVFQVAITIFLAGSALSGLSHTMTELIVFRIFQGLGAGGIITSAMAIIGDILSPRERGKYQGYLVATYTLAAVSGPAIGGFLTESFSWRWCFYVNVPIGMVTLVVTSVVLNLNFTRVRHRIDYLGVGLFCCAITAIMLVTVWGGGAYAWGSPEVIGTGTGGFVLLAVFVWWEGRAVEPLLPLRLLRNSTFRLYSIGGFLAMAMTFGTITYLPLFLQLVTGAAPTLSGVLIMPQSVAGSIAGIFIGRWVSKTGRYKLPPTIGAVIATIGALLLTTLNSSTPLWLTAIYMAVIGAGTGLAMPILLVAVQNAVSRDDLGTATSANMFFRQMGSAVAVAVFGSVMNARLRYWLPRLLPPGSKHLNAASLAYSPAAVKHLPAVLRHAVVDAFARSLHPVFWLAVPVAALMVPIFAISRELPLRRDAHIFTNEVAAEAALLASDAHETTSVASS